MKRTWLHNSHLMMSLLIVICSLYTVSTLWAAGNSRKIMVVGNKNDMAVAKNELDIRERLRKLIDEGRIDKESVKVVVFDYSVGEHRKHLEKLGISTSDLPFLGLAELSPDGVPIKIYWKTRGQDPDAAVALLCSEMGITVPMNKIGGNTASGDSGINAAPQKKDQALAIAKKAEECLNSGDNVTSIQEYTKAMETDQACAIAYFGRGLAYYNTKEYARAAADLSLYVALVAKDYRGYKFRGYAYKNLKDLDRALSDFEKYVELNPNDPEAYTALGTVYKEKNEIDRALREYDKALSLKPDFVPACFCRGVAYYDKKDYDRALSDFVQAFSLKPDYTEAVFSRGNCYYNKKMYDRAIEDYSRAIQLNPRYWPAYSNRAKSYYCIKDYTKAWTDVRRCREAGAMDDASFVELLRKASGRKE